MLRQLTPTLFALATAAGLWAAEGDVARDQQALAIKALIEGGVRVVAQRQMTAWQAAGYSDVSPTIKGVLDDAYAQAFDVKFDDARMKKYEPKGLPPIIYELAGTGGGFEQIIRLVNDIGKIFDLNAPKPEVVPAAEKVTVLTRKVQKLGALFEKEYAAAHEKVKANKKIEDDANEMEEKDRERQHQILQQAVLMRIDCLRLFYYANLVLGEVALRGGDYTLDAKAANDLLSVWAKQYLETVADWDFNWAEMHPQLSLYCAVAAGEGVRQKQKGFKDDEADSAFARVCEFDISQVGASSREAVQTLIVNAWAERLMWRLRMAEAKSYDRGIADFLDFKKKFTNDRDVRLDHPDSERAYAVGRVYLIAGRIYAAKGDAATAGTAWAEVKKTKGQPLAWQAGRWMTGDRGIPGQNEWGADPLPADPSLSLTLARSLIGEGQNASPAQAREYFLKAAVGLRAGVLGLSTASFADQFVESGPQVYRLYASALSKLGMSYHAAAAATEGLRQISLRISEKNNPWRDHEGKWTKSGTDVEKLVGSALTLCSRLAQQAKTKAAKDLYDTCVELAGKVDPKAVGEGLKWMLVTNTYNEGDYAAAIEAARSHAKEFPPAFAKCADLILRCRQALMVKAEAEGNQTRLAELQKELEENVVKIEDWIAKQDVKDPGVAKLRTSVASAKIAGRLRSGQFDTVITDLNAEFFRNVDPELGVPMLKFLAQAVYRKHLALTGVQNPKTDKPKAPPADELTAAWKVYAEAMLVFKKQAKRLASDQPKALHVATSQLASVANQVSVIASSDPKLAELVDAAKRAFADFIEPTINDKSKPDLILAVATTLSSIGESARAVRLYQLYQTTLEADAQVIAYRADPEAALKPYAELFTARTEFKKAWDEVVDLLSDPPGFLTDLLRGGETAVEGKGRKRDYGEALTKIEALSKLVDGAGFLDAESKKSMSEGVERLRGMSSNLAYAIEIDSRLATYYRENGESAKAAEIYRRLYRDYDPLNPAYSEGYVEGVLRTIAEGGVLADDAISQARDVAARNLAYFERRPHDRDSFWLSYLQVFELTKALSKGQAGGGEMDAIKKDLHYRVLNKSTPRHDLAGTPVAGDDLKVARPRNPLAIDIARRCLLIFDEVKVEKPYRIEEVSAGGQTITVFVDADAGEVVGETLTDNDGNEFVVVKLAGAAVAPPAPASEAAPVPAPKP